MISQDRLVKTFLELVAVDSPSGDEAEVAELLLRNLAALGLNVRRDHVGNVIATLDGEGEAILLSAHMDTVQPGRGIQPQVKDGIITSDGSTILGGDDKSGIAVILEVLTRLKETEDRHRPLDVVLSVGEEVGLVGAKGVDVSMLRAGLGLVLDSGGPIGAIVRQAPAQDALRVVVHGKASHAGAEPEKGINAILVAAEAITEMPQGRIDEETTANIGKISGGVATNIIADRVEMAGEARSLSNEKLAAQTRRMVDAIEKAAKRHGASADIQITRSYDAYLLPDDDLWVQHLVRLCRECGLTPVLQASGGGSDANIYNARQIRTAVISTGMANVHTTEEQIAIADMAAAAEFLYAVVTDL